LQQRSNESAFFGQKRFRADEARVISGAVVIAIGGENRCAHRERRLAPIALTSFGSSLRSARQLPAKYNFVGAQSFAPGVVEGSLRPHRGKPIRAGLC
jgi:hypothetical protein